MREHNKNIIKQFDNLPVVVSKISYDSTDNCLDILEQDIMDYLKDNYPNTGVKISKIELKEKLEKEYRNRNYDFQKKAIEMEVRALRHNIEINPSEEDKLIKELLYKFRILFSKLHLGMNPFYLHLIEDCTNEVMAMLNRRNDNISFAKNIELIRFNINEMIKNSYFKFMKDCGTRLSSKYNEMFFEQEIVDIDELSKNK